MASDLAERVYERARELMEADLGDELVALDVKGGLCFGFNAAATSVWRLLDRPRSLGELTDCLLDEYEVEEAECREDTAELLAQMVEHGLLRVR